MTTANDQLKTHLRGPGRVLRSRLPDLVHQEIWAWMIVHYALARLITQAAQAAEIDPDRISFTGPAPGPRSATGSAAVSPEDWNGALETYPRPDHRETLARTTSPHLPARGQESPPQLLPRQESQRGSQRPSRGASDHPDAPHPYASPHATAPPTDITLGADPGTPHSSSVSRRPAPQAHPTRTAA
jgi:hypothetical protein